MAALNLPVYVVCPIDREGCSYTLHRNNLLPISHNLEQEECDNAVEGGGSNEPTPVPHMGDALLVDHPIRVDWRAYLAHHQNNVNWMTQGQLG